MLDPQMIQTRAQILEMQERIAESIADSATVTLMPRVVTEANRASAWSAMVLAGHQAFTS